MVISDLNYIQVVSENNDIQGGRNTASAIALASSLAIGSKTYTAAGTATSTTVVLFGGSSSTAGSASFATARY